MENEKYVYYGIVKYTYSYNEKGESVDRETIKMLGPVMDNKKAQEIIDKINF